MYMHKLIINFNFNFSHTVYIVHNNIVLPITDGSCNPNRGISFTLTSFLIEGSFSENAWIGLGFRLDAVEVRGSELCIWVKSAKPPVMTPKTK